MHAKGFLLPTPTADSDEDGCLNLNIWSPDPDGPPRPVLVWIHGGGYALGSGGWPRYDGGELAQAGNIVVVTLNYRLGPLGCLYLPELTDDLGNGNLGLLDQMAVLRWVHANVAAFGGDPSMITVGGQSAGGASTLLLKWLLKRAGH